MTSIVDWKEFEEDESLPVATEEMLRLIPASHAAMATVVILPNTVLEKIVEHLQGDCAVERIGVLTGRPYTDPVRGRSLVYVDTALPVNDVDATLVHVSIQKSGWEDIWRSLSVIPESRIVGWYHSHPNHGVFLSATDRATQSLWFAQEWKIAFVVDPVRGEYQAFAGAAGTPTPLVLI